ncbi:MAG: class I SAM-dependent methyltransferase [Acidobacteriota bacterium]|nr:class I SAM-dependent methyltransferase [Acidobacteriota bacterium]
MDLAFDLEVLPWPIESGSVEHLRAIDVFEHLHLEVQQWLDEAWRVLMPGGVLEMRLPAWDHHYSYRDPTHYRVFHPETFHYWCPNAPGSVWEMFGQFYFGEGYDKWWEFELAERNSGDFFYRLRKPVEAKL